MAADCIGNSGETFTVAHSDLIKLQEIARNASIEIEMDIQYFKEDVQLMYDKLSPDRGTAIVNGFLKFIKKSGGFIIY